MMRYAWHLAPLVRQAKLYVAGELESSLAAVKLLIAFGHFIAHFFDIGIMVDELRGIDAFLDHDPLRFADAESDQELAKIHCLVLRIEGLGAGAVREDDPPVHFAMRTGLEVCWYEYE